MPDNNNRTVVPRSPGFFKDISNRVRLIGRLVVDPRVNPIVKLLPVGALLYVIFPDLLPLNPIDDALVAWVGSYLFVELCPTEVVAEHMRLLEGSLSGDGAVPASEDVVEGEFYEQRDPPRDPNGP
jgi:hypothetical protein